jgi:hypothetical protein
MARMEVTPAIYRNPAREQGGKFPATDSIELSLATDGHRRKK